MYFRPITITIREYILPQEEPTNGYSECQWCKLHFNRKGWVAASYTCDGFGHHIPNPMEGNKFRVDA